MNLYVHEIGQLMQMVQSVKYESPMQLGRGLCPKVARKSSLDPPGDRRFRKQDHRGAHQKIVD